MFSVMLRAVLGRFLMVMFGLKVMTMSDVRVMVTLPVMSFLVSLGGLGPSRVRRSCA